MSWTRKQTNPGTAFTLDDTSGGVIIRRVTWDVPGFKNRTGSGWAVVILGDQYGPAHRSATEAMRWAELPGVARQIAATLVDREDGDEEEEEVRRDAIVAQVMEWTERGADPTDLAGILEAAGNLRAWMAAHPSE